MNFPREFRYCNGSEFEFSPWINKPLFGSKAIASRYLFMDSWDTKQRALSLNLISCSWYDIEYVNSYRRFITSQFEPYEIGCKWCEFSSSLHRHIARWDEDSSLWVYIYIYFFFNRKEKCIPSEWYHYLIVSLNLNFNVYSLIKNIRNIKPK